MSGSFSSGPRPDADCDLEWVSATRFVAERALRERLLAVHGNVQLRTGCWVTGLEHGRADTSGAVTGVQICCSSAFAFAVHAPGLRVIGLGQRFEDANGISTHAA